MSRRPLRDERGMVMGLTIMLVVVIGVLGAGLLVFVQRDLEVAARYNGGARALGLADTGVEAATRELLENPRPEAYDGGSPTDLPHPESPWSFASTPAACAGLGQGPGRCVEAEGGVIRVDIRYLPPPTAAAGAGSVTDPAYAPVAPPDGAPPDGAPADGAPASPRAYFRITSDGAFGEHRRRVQAIVSLEAHGSGAEPVTDYRTGLWSWRECRESACLRDPG